MKRRHIFILAAVVMVLALVVIAWPRGPKEPVYEGKTLTQCMEKYNTGSLPFQNPALRKVFDDIGTNALPFLLSEFTRPISPWRRRLGAWLVRHPSLKIHLRSDEERIAIAMRGLLFLGSNAAPAVPIVLQHLNDPERGEGAHYIVAFMGKVAVPHLIEALKSPNLSVATNAVEMLGYHAANHMEALDGLALALNHSDPNIRVAAVKAWTGYRFRAETVVNGLLKMANDPNSRVVQEVTNQLAWLTRNAPAHIADAASNALLTLRTNAP